MNTRRTVLAICLGILLVITADTLLVPAASGAGGNMPPLLTFITNDAATPVPVEASISGNVQLADGTSVTANQGGSWNVGISGTPTVGVMSSETDPLIVRDISQPAPSAKTAAASAVHFGVLDGEWERKALHVITAPTDAWLVLTSLSIHLEIDGAEPSEAYFFYRLGPAPSYHAVHVPLTRHGTTAGKTHFAGTVSTELLVPPGVSVTANVSKSSRSGHMSVEANAAGYTTTTP
jgi:hypothetical protein